MSILLLLNSNSWAVKFSSISSINPHIYIPWSNKLGELSLFSKVPLVFENWVSPWSEWKFFNIVLDERLTKDGHLPQIIQGKGQVLQKKLFYDLFTASLLSSIHQYFTLLSHSDVCSSNIAFTTNVSMQSCSTRLDVNIYSSKENSKIGLKQVSTRLKWLLECEMALRESCNLIKDNKKKRMERWWCCE